MVQKTLDGNHVFDKIRLCLHPVPILKKAPKILERFNYCSNHWLFVVHQCERFWREKWESRKLGERTKSPFTKNCVRSWSGGAMAALNCQCKCMASFQKNIESHLRLQINHPRPFLTDFLKPCIPNWRNNCAFLWRELSFRSPRNPNALRWCPGLVWGI